MINVSLPPSSFGTAVIYDSIPQISGVKAKLPVHVSATAGTTFKAAGDKFSLPREYAGKTCICAVYDMKGRFIRELTVNNRTVDLSKDFGMPQGAYIVHVKKALDK
jgi:hypothetical protein